MSELGQFALGIAFGLAALGFFFGPIGKALGARISGGKARRPGAGLTTGEMAAERLSALEDRIAELESERGQLEDRLEFAERILTRGDADRTPGLKAEG